VLEREPDAPALGVTQPLGERERRPPFERNRFLVERFEQLLESIALERPHRLSLAHTRPRCKRHSGLAPRRPDPILRLITTLVRSLPYVIDGEPESALQSESDQGFLFEPSQGRVQISVFKGSDAFDPEEYIVEGVSMSLEEFGEQLIEMGDRMIALLERHDPEYYDSDDYAKSMIELLDVAKGAFRSYRLETERGLRP